MFLLASMVGGMRSQEVIIGTGTTSGYDVAFYPYYEDSWWESIYLPSEIGMPGLITAVALQSGSGPALTADNVYIYIGTRSSSSYSSTTDWTPLSALTLAYSGTNVPLGGSNGWENYTLQTPFMYDGSSNLVIVFAKHASDYSFDAEYYYSSTDGYQSLCRYMDEDPTYAQYSSTITGSRKFTHPNIKLSLTPDSTYCGSVSNIQVSGITTDEATISWDVPFNPNSYIVQVKTQGQNWNNPNVMTFGTPDTFLTVTGLNPSTTYNVRVANDCMTDTSNFTSANFTTLCAPTSALPIMENFDSYTHTSNNTSGANNLPNCWDYVNTGTSNTAYPYVYYAANSANSGNYSLRFYTSSSNENADHIAFLPALDNTVVTLQDLSLGLYMRRQGNSGTFSLVVGVTEEMNLSTFVPIDTLTSNSSTYAYHEVSLSGYVGNGNRIVLKAPKPSSGNNRGHVDDIVLGSNLCAIPSNLSVTNADEYSLTLQWLENGTATSWEIEYGPVGFTTGAGTTVTVSSNPYTVTGLTPATTYEFQVRANCGGSFSDWSLSRISGATTCIPITTIPFTENFDSYTHTSNPNNGTGTSNVPLCWDTYNSGSSYPAYPYVYYSSTNAYSGNYSLRFYTSTGNNYSDEYAILPAIDISIPLNTLQISMMARSNAANTPFTLVVGEMSGGPSTFVPIDTLTIAGTSYAAYVAYLDTYTGSGNRIALKAPKLSSNNRGYVDNIVVDVLSTCRMVSNVSVSDITTTSASVSWQPNGTETSWLVEYRATGDTVWQTAYASAIPFLLTGLTAATTYQVHVSADCGSELSGASANVSFTTVVCDTADQCIYTFNLADSFGDGWNNASLRVQQAGHQMANLTISNSSSSSATYQVALCDAVPVTLVWSSGSYDDECSFEVVDPFGEVIYTASDPSSGTLTTLNVSCTPPSCPRPSGITVSNIGNDAATISWVSTGSETAWNIEYKTSNSSTWILEPVTTNPYTLAGLTGLTNYDVRVQADCGGEVSDWRQTSFQTAACPAADQCGFVFNLVDSYGDGWNDASLIVQQNGVTVAYLGLDDGYSLTQTLYLCDAASITLVWSSGDFDSECSVQVTDPFNETIFTSSSLSSGTLTTFTAHCTPPTCLIPASIAVSNIGTTSAMVDWIPNASGSETAWNLEYKQANSSTWTSIPVSSTSYMLTGLTQMTNYDLRVQADCGGGDVSDWRTTTFHTNMCEANEQCSYSITVHGDYTDSWDYCSLSVQQNGITVATISEIGDYSTTITIPLCHGVSTSLVFTSGLFDDECSMAMYGPDGTQVFSQADMTYFTTYTFVPDCGIVTTCDVPSGLAVINVTATTATAIWTAGGTETSWNVQFKVASASNWQNATTNTTGYTMTGLTPNTAYQVRVQAVCGANDVSEWTNAVSFNTSNGTQTCPAPTNLAYQLGDPSHTTVTFTWQQEANTANEWQLNYRMTTEDTWSTATATSTTYTLTDLVPNVDYEANVVAHCTNGLTSDASNTVTWHTDDVGIQGYLERSVTLYPNPATEMISVAVSDANIMITGVEVYNVYGQLVNTIVSTENPLRINVSGLADGMYYVRVTTDGGVVTKNFVKR